MKNLTFWKVPQQIGILLFFSWFAFLITQYIYIYNCFICLGKIQYCFRFQRKCQKHFWLLPFEQNLVQILKQILKKKIKRRQSSAFVPTLSKFWVTAHPVCKYLFKVNIKDTWKTPTDFAVVSLSLTLNWCLFTG